MPLKGNISSSQVKLLLVNGKSESGFGAGALTYARQLAREMIGAVEPDFMTYDMERGIETEWQACEVYAERQLVKLIDCGWRGHPIIPHYGGTADRLIGDMGGVEVKCPNNPNHHLNLIGPGQLGDHLVQIQSYIDIYELDWMDYVSYNENYPEPLDLAIKRVYRDDDMIERIQERVTAFWPIVEIEYKHLESLITKGIHA